MYLALFLISCFIIVIAVAIWGIIENKKQKSELKIIEKDVGTTEKVYKNVGELPQETGDYVLLIVNNKVVQGYRASIGDVDLFFDECGSLISDEKIELLQVLEENIVFAGFLK